VVELRARAVRLDQVDQQLPDVVIAFPRQDHAQQLRMKDARIVFGNIDLQRIDHGRLARPARHPLDRRVCPAPRQVAIAVVDEPALPVPHQVLVQEPVRNTVLQRRVRDRTHLLFADLEELVRPELEMPGAQAPLNDSKVVHHPFVELDDAGSQRAGLSDLTPEAAQAGQLGELVEVALFRWARNP